MEDINARGKTNLHSAAGLWPELPGDWNRLLFRQNREANLFN